MAAPKGHKRYGGRKKGSQNKITLTVKDSVLKAFDELGGVPSLVEWAQTPTGRAEFYRIWAKLIPAEVKTEVTGKDGEPLRIIEEIIVSRAQVDARS